MASPPPLRHPVPTHPAYIPEPPLTPGSPQGYQRFSSSPAPGANGPAAAAYPAHVPAYTTPFQHSQPQHLPPHLQPQQPQHQPFQPQPPPHHQPDFGAWGIDGATAQLGMQLGSTAMAAGQDYMQRNFGAILPSSRVKHHFNVSNSYVIKKLRLVVFPWSHKSWARHIHRNEQGVAEWQPPRDDVNSPDLYIPVMAVVTYILLAALYSGLNERFHPEILGQFASRAIVVLLFDFGFVKTGCYFLNIQGPSQIADIAAYTGYKFIGVILALTAGFLGIKGVWWTLLFVYACAASALFIIRSLRSVVFPDASISPSSTSTSTLSPPQRRRRMFLLFGEAMMQVVYMGVLVRI